MKDFAFPKHIAKDFRREPQRKPPGRRPLWWEILVVGITKKLPVREQASYSYSWQQVNLYIRVMKQKM